MKKVLVYYLYSEKNAGDMAICFGLLDLLECIHDISITVVSRYSGKENLFVRSKWLTLKYHPNINVKPGYIKYNRDGSKLSKLKSYLSGFVISSFPSFNKNMKKEIKEADLVLFNGGNFLRTNSFADRSRMKALFFPLKYAKKHGKTVICMPQSTTTAKSKKALRKLEKTLNVFDYIFLRDPLSYSYFKEHRMFDEQKYSLSCDLAFFSNEPVVEKMDEHLTLVKTKNIAINCRLTSIGDIGEISEDKKADIANTYEHLITNYPEYQFNFICQTEKDYPFMNAFYKKLLEKGIKNIGFFKNNDPYILKSIYKKHDLLISMRLHASILAISSGIKVIGFSYKEWGFKNAGILNQFGFKNFENGQGVIDSFESVLAHDKAIDTAQLSKDFKDSILEKMEGYIK